MEITQGLGNKMPTQIQNNIIYFNNKTSTRPIQIIIYMIIRIQVTNTITFKYIQQINHQTQEIQHAVQTG